MIKNKINKLIYFIKENKWILLVSLVFIGWKFFLISVLFNHEWSTGEEAQTYVYHINTITKCPYLVFCHDVQTSFTDYFGFEHLSYRLFFGFISKISTLDATEMFQLSFYFGILFLLPSLIIFLKSIETDKKLIPFLLLFVVLYNGGRYHGFWWIVPDFFAVLLIFIIFAIIVGNFKHWKIILSALIPIGYYTHMIFVYMLAIPLFYLVIYSCFKGTIDKIAFKKMAFSIFILLIFYLPTTYYLNMVLKDNPYGVKSFIINSNIINSISKPTSKAEEKISLETTSQPSLDQSQIVDKSSEQLQKNDSSVPPPEKQTTNLNNQLFPGFVNIKNLYFDWILFNPLFIAVFIYIIFILFRYKQHKILSLYSAALIFSLLSSINEHADRSLVFIWPITFLLYAYGFWFSFKLIEKKLQNKTSNALAKLSLYFSMVVFVTINLIYSYGINTDILFGLQDFITNYVRNNW